MKAGDKKSKRQRIRTDIFSSPEKKDCGILPCLKQCSGMDLFIYLFSGRACRLGSGSGLLNRARYGDNNDNSERQEKKREEREGKDWNGVERSISAIQC